MSGLLTGLPNAQLLDRVRDLVRRGNTVEAELLAHLAEIDAPRLYLEEGCTSMFTYCQRVLHFAEGVAYFRLPLLAKAFLPVVLPLCGLHFLFNGSRKRLAKHLETTDLPLRDEILE